jgi:hypothetical protein
VFAAARTRDVRTLVYGVAGTGLQRVTVTVAGGEPRTLRHTPEGGFLFALRGYPEDVQPVVTLRRDGRTRRYGFADGGAVVPDPLGGRAWKLQAFGYGTGAKPGAPQPRRRPGCVSFSTARSVPGEANVISPPVCGWQPGRAGVPQETLFFQTKRLSGNRTGRDVMLTGDWNGHAPRTAVWGSAREHRRIVVRAPGIRREVAPRLNAGFLVLLPATVDPSAVTVEVDGKR